MLQSFGPRCVIRVVLDSSIESASVALLLKSTKCAKLWVTDGPPTTQDRKDAIMSIQKGSLVQTCSLEESSPTIT